jgi:AmiR/NasT family two-component response regulator
VSHADKPADTRAPEAIENEIEATRDRLAVTIDQLLYRSSPKTIARREVAGIKGYFVDPVTGPRTDNILKVAAGVGGFLVVMLVVRKVAK